MVRAPSLSSIYPIQYALYSLFHIHLFVYLALLVDGELPQNRDCLLTLFLVSETQ